MNVELNSKMSKRMDEIRRHLNSQTEQANDAAITEKRISQFQHSFGELGNGLNAKMDLRSDGPYRHSMPAIAKDFTQINLNRIFNYAVLVTTGEKVQQTPKTVTRVRTNVTSTSSNGTENIFASSTYQSLQFNFIYSTIKSR